VLGHRTSGLERSFVAFARRHAGSVWPAQHVACFLEGRSRRRGLTFPLQGSDILAAAAALQGHASRQLAHLGPDADGEQFILSFVLLPLPPERWPSADRRWLNQHAPRRGGTRNWAFPRAHWLQVAEAWAAAVRRGIDVPWFTAGPFRLTDDSLGRVTLDESQLLSAGRSAEEHRVPFMLITLVQCLQE